MVTKEYSIALAEVNHILKFSISDIRHKIPYKFRKFIVQNMDKTLEIHLDLSKPIDEQPISVEAKNLIALIYRDYLVSAEEKQSLIQQELSNKEKHEQNLKKLYNPDNIFKNKKITHSPSLQLTVVQEENFISKLFNYIKSLFKKK